MKKRTIFQTSFVLLVLVLIVARGKAKALDQLTVYLPVTFRNYCPDFIDDFSDPASGWYVWEDEDASWEYLDGEYRILSKNDYYEFYYADAPTCARENYTVEVDARWVGEPGNSYGILFGIIGDLDQYYIWDMNTDYQEYGLWRFDGNEYHTIVPITSSYDINSGNASNHLKVTRYGNKIELEVNGIGLYTWTDNNITGATYTAILSSPYEGYPTSDARFDNFSILSINIPTTGWVEIVYISMHGTGSSEPDEYVEIENDDSVPIQLMSWTLVGADHVFTFPSLVFQPNQKCRIYTNEYHPEWCGLSYESNSAIWKSTGDTANLWDADGLLIDDYSY